jgi:hypothetical protein
MGLVWMISYIYASAKKDTKFANDVVFGFLNG